MNNPNIKLICKLADIFAFLGFKNKDLENLKQKIVLSCSSLAYSELIATDKSLADKLKGIDENEESLRQLASSDFLSLEQRQRFFEEFKKSLGEYVEKLSSSLDQNKRARIQEIWKS